MLIYKLFSCCRLVAGARRALIVDQQRHKYYTIPLSMANLLTTYENKPYEAVVDDFPSEDERQIIKEYYDFLIGEELVFECPLELSNNFPAISDHFKVPHYITNGVVQLKEFNESYIVDVLQQLTGLKCYCVELNIFFPINIDLFKHLLDLCQSYEIEDLQIHIKYDNAIDKYIIEQRRPHLTSVVFYGCEKIASANPDTSFIYYSNKELSDKNCGLISEKLFNTSIEHYTESLNHNTCLNRKVAIDIEGNIKNCPGMNDNFGNIRGVTLKEAIDKPGFRKYWDITKDHVAKCKDCEFRHICTDCRAYLDNPDDLYSAPLKCGYDPYRCQWEDWSRHPLKQMSIDHYEMREIL